MQLFSKERIAQFVHNGVSQCFMRGYEVSKLNANIWTFSEKRMKILRDEINQIIYTSHCSILENQWAKDSKRIPHTLTNFTDIPGFSGRLPSL